VAFLRRKQAEGGDAALRLYYASDIHGTEVLWKKFLNAPKVYNARVLVMGGDITGKVVIPIVQEADGTWSARLFGGRQEARDEAELDSLERRVRGNGMYPYRTTHAEVDRIAGLPEEERERWFESVMLHTFGEWIKLADDRLAGSGIRCFVMPGNDDPQALEDCIRQGINVESCDEAVVEFDGYTMLSLGYSNRTPWDSPRELDEDQLYQRIHDLSEQVPDMRRCVFNLHVPPYDSRLDTAAELDENFKMVLIGKEPHMIPVGSTAVREAIEQYQPVVSLHGHIHESPAANRIGRTLCINPGSDYPHGILRGAILSIKNGKVKGWTMSNG
jgi:Icc-related predicted phosphoesterase